MHYILEVVQIRHFSISSSYNCFAKLLTNQKYLKRTLLKKIWATFFDKYLLIYLNICPVCLCRCCSQRKSCLRHYGSTFQVLHKNVALFGNINNELCFLKCYLHFCVNINKFFKYFEWICTVKSCECSILVVTISHSIFYMNHS